VTADVEPLSSSQTPDQIIASLTLELAHVSEQCRMAHRMALAWKARCLTCEAELRRLEKRLTPKQVQAAQQRLEERLASVQFRFSDLFTEGETAEGQEGEGDRVQRD
jgi:hypothetical protein